jgi:hypothetical protein
VVCSACGYENQTGNRFCGMCGTPLPHPPLTAPGAQGTHSLTRVPVETAHSAERLLGATCSETTAAGGTGVVIEAPSVESRNDESSQSENLGPIAPAMVPEVPLEEYVKSFQYTPPADPEEVTMRGDAQVSPAEAPVATDPPAPPQNETVGAATTLETVPNGPTEDVADRLGLEPIEERVPGSRYLDIGGLPPPRKPAIRTSDSAARSILGLHYDGAPPISTEAGDPVEVIRTRIQQDRPRPLKKALRSRSVWLAAVVVLFAGAGFVGWRSLVRTGDGSVADMKMKARELWQDIRSNPAEAPPAPLAVPADTATKTKAVVEEPAKAPQQAAAADSNLVPPGKGTEPPLTPHTSVPSAKSPDTAAKQPVPGMEEVTKANNASDSAAAAAWLWKATAKGNPDAPVRLADRYIKGDGVPRSCEQALVLLKTAATKENAAARNRLAALYTSGTCVQRNRVEAYRWLSSALVADPNSHWAQENRELVWQQMTADERAAAQRYR